MTRRTFGLGVLLFPRQCSRTPAPASAPRASALEWKVHEAVNLRRSGNGVRALQWNDALAAEARAQSASMLVRRFFSHDDPVRGSLRARLGGAGFKWRKISENLYREQGYADPARSAVEGWMTSPGHRRNLLDPDMTETGVGIMAGSDETYYITQIFLLPFSGRR